MLDLMKRGTAEPTELGYVLIVLIVAALVGFWLWFADKYVVTPLLNMVGP